MAHQNLVASSQARYADPTIRKIVTTGLAEASARNVAGINKKPSDSRFLTPICSFVALALTRVNRHAESFKHRKRVLLAEESAVAVAPPR